MCSATVHRGGNTTKSAAAVPGGMQHASSTTENEMLPGCHKGLPVSHVQGITGLQAMHRQSRFMQN